MANLFHPYSEFDDFINLVICPEEELQKHQNFPYSPSSTTSLNQSQSQLSSVTNFDSQEIRPSTLKGNPQTHFMSHKHAEKNSYNNDIRCEKLQLESESEYQGEILSLKPKQKNSNSIKKIGRIILDHISQYSNSQVHNSSLNQMVSLLSRSKKGEVLEQYKKRDRFNTHHLSLLLNSQDKKLSNYNLRTTRKLLSKFLRKEVLKSDQIKERGKLVYMNTMKCSSLRCVNSKLAVRLQMSAQFK